MERQSHHDPYYIWCRMPSRITFRYLELAQQSIQEFTNNLDKPHHGDAQLQLAKLCLQISKAEVNGGFRSDSVSLESRIQGVLSEAAAARSTPKPLWAGYAEATL